MPKKDSHKRRVIIDLSHPEGASVNDGVPKNSFQGRPFTYTLPSAHDLASSMLLMGPSCYLWKADLQRAYRQLRSDPLDYPLMGIRHGGATYLDVCPSFGCRGSSAAQQRVSRAVCHLLRQAGHTVLAYVDDFCGVAATPGHAHAGFQAFHSLCDKLGLKLAPEKSAPPSTQLEWLGFDFNTSDTSVTIPKEKLAEIVDLSRAWTYRKRASRRDLQVLAGKLMHVSQCILPARRFLSRVLAALRGAPITGTTRIGWNSAVMSHGSSTLLRPSMDAISLRTNSPPSKLSVMHAWMEVAVFRPLSTTAFSSPKEKKKVATSHNWRRSTSSPQ